MSVIRVPLSEPGFSSTEPPHAQPQIVFTRQLWERTMPSADNDDLSTSPQGIASGTANNPRRVSLNNSDPPQRLQPSPKARVSDTPLTPEESPPFQDNGKRSADALGHTDSREHSPTHTIDGSIESPVNFCLCQPEPKVPRPRNAFILYRQNHQASVVAQHPGLANPDISKIIGEQWRREPEEERNRWKAYAEEEKLQHQQRFPQYRYQPKRSGRRGSISSDTGGSSQSESRKCQKCGGRTIIHPSPSTSSSARERIDKLISLDTGPSSTHPPVPRTNTFQLPPPTPSSTTTPSTRYLPMLNNLSLSSPRPRNMNQGRHPQQSFVQQHQRDEDHVAPFTPDAKRRRFGSPQGTYVMSTRAMPPRQNVGPGTPFPFGQPSQQGGPPGQQHGQQIGPPHAFLGHPGTPQQIRRESLPRPADILRGHAASGPTNMMGPPPRPGPGYSQHRASQGLVRGGGSELSLTLPPLHSVNVAGAGPSNRTGLPQPLNSGDRGAESAKEADNRSVGEMIMSMSYLAKVQILGRVAPPFPASDGKKPRATIIAIEGDSADAARGVTDWLEEFLGREGDMTIKVIDGPKIPAEDGQDEIRFQDLLRTVSEWHGKSREIEEVAKSPRTPRKGSVVQDQEEGGEAADNDDEGAMELDSTTSGSDGKKLVVLLRTYTVTATNVYASRVAIKDTYKAADHWQWTATLWRGIVGPDMTVYVKDVENKEESGKGGVDIKEKDRIMAVRRVKGGEDGGVEGVEAGTLRRLAFEVGEWIRSAGGRTE